MPVTYQKISELDERIITGVTETEQFLLYDEAINYRMGIITLSEYILGLYGGVVRPIGTDVDGAIVTTNATQTLTNKGLYSPLINGYTTTVHGDKLNYLSTATSDIQAQITSNDVDISSNASAISGNASDIANLETADVAHDAILAGYGTNSQGVLVTTDGTQQLANKDLIYPKINNVLLTTTGNQLNYLDTVTSDVQTQLNVNNASIASNHGFVVANISDIADNVIDIEALEVASTSHESRLDTIDIAQMKITNTIKMYPLIFQTGAGVTTIVINQSDILALLSLDADYVVDPYTVRPEINTLSGSGIITITPLNSYDWRIYTQTPLGHNIQLDTFTFTGLTASTEYSMTLTFLMKYKWIQ